MKRVPRSVRLLFSAALVSAALLSSLRPALAQSAPSSSSAPAGAPDDARREEVRARFMRGVELYQESEFKLALIEFERAYSIVPSYHILYNIGQVQQQLGRFSKALQTLERYLADGGDKIPEERKHAVEKDIATLRSRTAQLTVTLSEPGAEIVLDGESLGRSPVAPRRLVDAGEHRLVVNKPGFIAHAQTLVLAGGDDIEARVSLVRERPTSPPGAVASRGIAPWIGWGTAGLLTAGAVTTGVLAMGAASDLEEMTSRVTTEDERRATQSRGDTLVWVTNGLALGALVAGGVALYLTLRRPSREPAAASVAGPGRLLLRF